MIFGFNDYLKFCVPIFIIWSIIGNLRQKKGARFDVYFGVPGSGKTTFAAYLTKRRIKKKKNNVVLSNVPIKGAYKVEKSDIGHYQIDNCELILDEAGVDYDNRRYKSFTDDEVYFFKYHRHYNVDINMFSQDYEDFDKKLRKLATRYFIVKKSVIFPGFVKAKSIRKFIGIDKETKQIIEQYEFVKFFGTKWIYCPRLWKMFNSYDYKVLPPKLWKKYDEE